jgi:preprotein translocase subunit YajC
MTLTTILPINWVLLAQQTRPHPDQPAWASSQIVFPILLIVMMYFLLIHPQMKRQKEHAAMVASIKTGDQVVAAGGIHGVIANVKEKTVILKVAENLKLEVDKASVTLVTRASKDKAQEVA